MECHGPPRWAAARDTTDIMPGMSTTGTESGLRPVGACDGVVVRLEDDTGLGLADRLREALAPELSSPWLPLGRLDAAAGPATLSVRARDLAGLAVMNLNGLRLRRVA